MSADSAAREAAQPDSAQPGSAQPGSAREADPLREALLDAAARVIARQGYQGTKIQDIVHEAGLSSGAVYGRFRSKDELAREAIITRSVPQEHVPHYEVTKVADLVARNSTVLSPGLNDADALLLEAYVTAGRDPQVAEAVAEADQRWRQSTAPCVTAAIKDGTVARDVDPQAVLFLTRVLRLGLLLHRGSGLPGPDQEAWEKLVARVVASFGDRGRAPE
ncbi:MAG TPA: helix-turn-helix domain-containing protein [Streptosporangiaceae bacterium]|nr:helix-turn-helix domain-containing protein [Streptosporangiaceae bacterium]